MSVPEQIVYPLGSTPVVAFWVMAVMMVVGLWLSRFVRLSGTPHHPVTSATVIRGAWYSGGAFMLLVLAAQVFGVRWWYRHFPAPPPEQYDAAIDAVRALGVFDALFALTLLTLGVRAWPKRTYANRPFAMLMFSLFNLTVYQAVAMSYHSRLLAQRSVGGEEGLPLSSSEILACSLTLVGGALALMLFVWDGISSLRLMQYARPHKPSRSKEADPSPPWWHFLQYMGVGYPFSFWLPPLPPPPPPTSEGTDNKNS